MGNTIINPTSNRFQLSTVQLISNQTNAASTQVNQLAAEISTQGSASGFDTVDDVPRFLELKAQGIQNQGYLKNINIQQARLEAKTSCIQSIMDAANGMKGLISSVSQLTSQAVFQQQTNFYLDQVKNILNTKYLDDNLFGGTTKNLPPVIDLKTLPGVLPNSPADTSYYVGNNVSLQNQVDTGFFQTDDINASNPAFEQFIRALRLCQNATINPPDQLVLSTAQNLIDSAQKDLITSQQSIATMSNNLSTIFTNLNDQELGIQQGIKDAGYRDITDALADYTAQSATVRISEYMSMNMSRRIEKLVNSLPN